MEMNVLITFASLVLALSLLVFVHELGHLLAAKRAGVVVEEFGIGYPPRFFTFWRSEGKIILDGRAIVIPRKFKLPKGLYTRSLVLYETARDGKGREVLSRIEEVDPADPVAQSASSVELLDAGTVFSLNAIPFGGFAKMLGEEDPSFPGSLASKGKIARIVVLAAGSTMNLLMAVVFFSLAMGLGAPAVAEPENAVVTDVAPGSPAEEAGLQAGDVILKGNDTDILEIQDLLNFTQQHLGEQVVLTVQRGDELLEIAVVPRPQPPSGEGPMGIALGPRTTIKHYKWYEAIWLSIKQTISLVALIISVPIQLVRGLIPADMARPVGPVGVGQIVGDAVQYSLDTGWWFPVMQMMGSLSVAVAVTNLLPLPGLDGGRILFVVVEGIRGRRVDPAREGLIHFIGLMILVALMLFITWQDVVNPVPSLDWSSFF
jgi:regulator of sigma E protease